MKTKRIHNVQTNEVIDVELTEQELEQLELDKAKAEAKMQAKAEAETQRQALLAKLGITADEAKLLLGGN